MSSLNVRNETSSLATTPVIDDTTPISASPPVFSVYLDVDKHGTEEYYRNLIYKHYADVFVDKLPAQLPPLRAVNHRIPVKIDRPWMAPLYRLPEHHKKALEADIDLKLRASIVVPTTEIPLATSHMVSKKDPDDFRHIGRWSNWTDVQLRAIDENV
jgi:hypothetical protein